jgi:hypothetical protein
LLRAAGLDDGVLESPGGRNSKTGGRLGIVIGDGSDARGFAQQFTDAVAQHRHWALADAARPVPEANHPRGRAR